MKDNSNEPTIDNQAFAPLPPLPSFSTTSPAVVLIHDKVPNNLDAYEDFSEFCWFAREYSRCYRFHFDGAEFPLKSVYSSMQVLRTDLIRQLSRSKGDTFECSLGDRRVEQVYWDFESFLSEVSISLDLLARVVGPAFPAESPPSFNKLCKLRESHPLLDLFRSAQKRWVYRLKDYRDCFTHYTPVDTMLFVVLRKYDDQWEIRAKLPTNPNIRDIVGFRFSRRVELLRYALSVHKDLIAFDRAVAREISRLFRAKNYPSRKDNLFFVGRRFRV